MVGALVRLWRSARIGGAGQAYVACCFLSTAVVAALSLPLIAWNLTRLGLWDEFDPLAFIMRGVEIWFVLSIVGVIVAFPFVPAVTWVGARLRMENLLYYCGIGGLTVCALVYLLYGPPRETDFGETIIAWIVGPPCGAAWGGTWWILHRRWIARPKQERATND